MEQWRAVVGYAGYYEVSDHGRVRSLARPMLGRNGCTRILKGRVLRFNINRKGYASVMLSKDGEVRRFEVHTLVAQAFIGPRPPGMEVRHLDGDCRNNCLSNLRYGTWQDNFEDKVRHGRNTEKENHPLAKLTTQQVDVIRKLGPFHRQKEIAKMFGIDQSTVSAILDHRRWR